MIQRSFSSGEVDPALYGRADVDRWKAALKLCKNWVVQPEGGIVVRQGFEMKYAATGVTMIPFEFGPSDSYILLFSSNSMRVLRNGLIATGDTLRTAIVNRTVTPWEVSIDRGDPHGYGNANTVQLLSGLNSGSTYVITTSANPYIFKLNGTVATSGSEYAYLVRTIGGSGAEAVYPTPSDLRNSRFVQSGDTIFFANTGYQTSPVKLIRESLGISRALSFRFEPISGAPTVYTSATLSVSGTAGTSQVRYRVTATDNNDVESAILRSAKVTSGAITGTTTLSVTSTGHAMITNDQLLVAADFLDVNGTVIYSQGDLVRVVYVDANTFTIPGSTSGAAPVGPLYYNRTEASALLTAPATATPTTVTWTSIVGARQYNVFKEFGRVFGYIGSTPATSFVDIGIIPDQKDTPVVGISPFGYGSSTWVCDDPPEAVGLFQQRLMFGGFATDTERIVGSHVGNYTAYDPGAEDASGLDFQLAGRNVSGIQHMLEIAGRAVVLSNTSEWVLKGGTSGGLTPTAINARADSYYGCSDVSPALIGTSVLFVQRGDKIVRDAKYDYSQEALKSDDLTLWAKHLFKDGVARLCYQRTAQILWALLNNGKLLGLTYIPEQNVWGWHQHEIDGKLITDICVVSESGSDRLYCSTSTAILRLPLPWESGNVDEHIGFDMSLSFDGTFTGTGTLTGGTDWTTDETLTLTCSVSQFVVGDVGKVFLLRLGDDSVYVTCTAYTSGTVVSVTPNTIVPVALQGVASESIARCAQTFSGLTHLEGATVGVIADGSREPDEVVAGGAITLDGWFARVQAGLVITADAQTLDVEPDEKDTYLGDYKHVTRVYLRVKDTRGLTVGLDATHLEPFMPQYEEDMLVNANPALQSGPVEVLMDSTHEELGSILMRQDTGLPATILNARPVFNAGELK